MSALYIHIPFCETKCFYCSFVINVGQIKKADDYLRCLSIEAEKYCGEHVGSIHIGGGTPSLLSEKQLIKLDGIIRRNFKFDDSSEYAIEVNPESIEKNKAKILRSLGVNRISLGVQTFNNQYLKYLGRNHDSARALTAFDVLREAGFNNVNIDLIYALFGQAIDEWKADLEQLLKLGCEHASLYGLTVEEQSRFYVRKEPEMAETDQALFFQQASLILGKGGFQQYEISNYAKPGYESVHNKNYWMGGNYIGLGVGAHSHKDGCRWWNTGRFNTYMKRITGSADAKEGEEYLSAQKRLCESLVFGLRMNEGVDMKDLESRFQEALDTEKKQKLNMFAEEGLLVRDGSRFKTTLKGRLILDEISSYLVC